MLSILRAIIPERSPVRLWYHKVSAILAALYYGLPGYKIRVIGVTGTSGKSTTTELIHHILHHSNRSCGSLSTVKFHFGGQERLNETLRTTLRPWNIQKYLRKMIRRRCEFAVIEVSSHALDQNRVWGISFDTAVITNLSDNEHLDYHKTFTDYLKTKMKLFHGLNRSHRKPRVLKTSVTNADDDHFELFHEIAADQKWTFSQQSNANVRAENIKTSVDGISFSLRLPNNQVEIKSSMIGKHNVENLLAAITVAISSEIPINKIKQALETFPGVPGRLERMPRTGKKQPTVIVDFSYKPSALEAVLDTLKGMTKKRLVVVWGGAGGRAQENWEDCAKFLDQFSDEIVLTTDDPGDTDPKHIAEIIRKKIGRTEGDGFFEIPDRYEAIKYAIFSAEPDDIVLVAGRGHELIQKIGHSSIEFDDREVCREVMNFLRGDI